MTPNESQLITQAQDGDRAAFGTLYDTYAPRIYAYCYRRTYNRTLAEDLTSIAFMNALEKIRTYRQRSNATFLSWLYAIARNVHIDHVRQHGRVSAIPEHFDMPERIPSATRTEAAADLARVREALNSLNETQRDIVLMRVWDDLPFKEIAAVLGKSEASCKMQFSRALKTLRMSFATLAFLLISTL